MNEGKCYIKLMYLIYNSVIYRYLIYRVKVK